MIRATQAGFYGMMTAQSGRQMSQLRAVQERAITGLAINHASDAPSQLAEVHRLRAATADQQMYGENASRATGILDAMDTALDSSTSILRRAREIAVEMANETNSGDERAEVAGEVSALRDSLVNMANSSYDGRYLFAGTAYASLAFDDTGTYLGNTLTPTIDVGPSQDVDAGADGSAIFQGGGTDAFQVLADLQTALETNDTAAILTAMDGIDAASANVIDSRVRLGASAASADDAASVSSALEAMLSTRLGELTEADPATTYTDLTTLQDSYQATLKVAAQVGTTDLFDLL